MFENPEYLNRKVKNLPKITSPNSNFPTLSKTVEITYKEEVGRYGVATDEIRAGKFTNLAVILIVKGPNVISHLDKINVDSLCDPKEMSNRSK